MHPIEASRVPELLAPAGGRAQFFAALNAGADAVYLGLKDFNARARADNFTPEELRELVPLARRFGMKVLVTVNVLVKETELARLVDTLALLEELEVSAIIVQDLAVARLARAHFPGLRLHASTQMAVHNLAGVREAHRHGFSRVVLARELTALEIKQIRAALPAGGMEIEAFCHGSLCYSYSGLCFFSGAADARSGNRGECAYTCRQPYKILNEPGHGFLFSMRDLDASDDLDALVGAGVDTLKIEGRKKDAQYVASVVKLYRQKLDEIFGRPTLREGAPVTAEPAGDGEALREDLSLSFQRRPTTFFLKGRYHENVIDLANPTHLGVRVGEVHSVAGGAVRLRTETPLERFDGLRVVEAVEVYHAKPQHGDTVAGTTTGMVQRFRNEAVEFSLREMRVAGRRAPVAPAGAWIDIEWPDGKPLPRAGDVLYKTRSADLKRRTLALEAPPADERLRALSPLALRFQLEARKVRVEAFKLGQVIASAEIEVDRVPARGAGDLDADLTSLFSVFGDQGFAASELVVEGESKGWFVPRSRLKDLKQALAAELPGRYRAFVGARRDAALTAIAATAAVPAFGPTRFSVKLDRLEALESLAAFAKAEPGFPLGEVLFEPKRAFLPALDPAALTRALLDFTAATGVPVRLAVPTVLRAWDEGLIRRWLAHAAGAGVRRYEIGNLGALHLLEEWGLVAGADLAADFTLYALNAEATRFWADRGIGTVTLSLEDDLVNLGAHLARWPWERGVRPRAILFKDTPLFIAEACSLTALHGGCPTAKVCGYRTLEIESPQGERFFVAHESCKSIVYAKDAFSLTHRREALENLGVRDFRLDFVTRPYTAEAMGAVLRAARLLRPVPGTHTANFDRSLL